jgi:hypothetical protein
MVMCANGANQAAYALAMNLKIKLIKAIVLNYLMQSVPFTLGMSEIAP